MGKKKEWDLNKDMTKLLYYIVSDVNIQKLIKYDGADPLSQPDLTNPMDLVHDRVFPFLYIPGVTHDAKTYLTVSFKDISKRGNSNFKTETVIVNFFTHKTLVRTYQGSRLLSLLPKIEALLTDGEKVDIGLGKLSFRRASELLINDDFIGYGMVFDVLEFD